MTRPRATTLALTTLALGALMVVASACGTQTAGSGGSPSPTATTPSPAATPSTPTPSTPTPSVTPTPTPIPDTGPRRVYWEDLEPGMCIDTKKLKSDYDFWVVPCAKKHNREVIANTTLPGTTTWPGDRAVGKASDTACRAAFKKYIGLNYNKSDLQLDVYTVDEQGWAEGDRTAVCFAFDPDHATVAHSLKGSRK